MSTTTDQGVIEDEEMSTPLEHLQIILLFDSFFEYVKKTHQEFAAMPQTLENLEAHLEFCKHVVNECKEIQKWLWKDKKKTKPVAK